MARQVGPSSQGANVFSQNTVARLVGPCGQLEVIIFRVIRRHLLAAAVDPTETLHVQYTSDGSRSLTMLTTPRREHQGGGRRRGLGRGRHGGREDSAVVSHMEGSTTVRGFTGSSAVAGE